jgi:uncharacterized protein YecE (DUF72 family)
MLCVGVAGWSYEDWKGTVYPRPAPRGFHPLPYLARYLDLVEVNSTFYALPRADLTARWAALVEPFPRFCFTVKLHRDFTHGPANGMSDEAARAFRDGIAPLVVAGRLIGLLAQFPVSLRESAAGWGRIERIRSLFPDETLVLELRHRTWFSGGAYERLAGMDLGLVHVDMPGARDHPPAEHPSLGPLGYLRLHGRNRRAWFDPRAGRDARYDHRYPAADVAAIARRLESIGARTERALLVANNHFGGQAVAAALEIRSLIEGVPARAPEPLVHAFPDLAATTTPEGQMTLGFP